MAKILLVEDDNNLREIYEARLQAEGYNIVSAKDGEEALAVAKAEKPDLVISDIMMPKISGFEMLDILRNTNDLKNIKIIMLTALGQNDDQQRANKLGADKYLVKSQVTLEDIVRSTHDLLSDTNKTGATAQPAPAAAAGEAAPVQPAPATPATEVAPVQPVPAAPQPTIDNTPAPAPAEPTTVAQPEADKPQTDMPATTVDNPATDSPQPTPADNNAQATADPATDNKPAEDSGQSEPTSKEQAEVDSKIEDFVSGASTDAPPPSQMPAQPPAADNTDAADDSASSQEAEPTSEESEDQPAEEVTEAPPEPSPTIDNPDPSKDKDPAKDENVVIEPTEPAAPTDISSETETASGSPSTEKVTIAHKKVISPLNKDEQPNIEKLYAAEQAKEGSGAEIKAQPIVVDSKSVAKAPENPDQEPPHPDPSSIAI